MQDELTTNPAEQGGGPSAPPAGAQTPAAPPMDPAAGETRGRARRPSWLRALLLSLIVLVAGAALGATGYRFERSHGIQPPSVIETASGWRIAASQGRPFGGLALNGPRLLWQNGPSIEYFDLASGKLRLLGPGPAMRATWAPAVGSRYAVWFEAERSGSLAAQAVAYDTDSGRRWTIADVGNVFAPPALSGSTAVWCSAVQIAAPHVSGVRIADGSELSVADEFGTPVIVDELVVWAREADGPFTAHELSGGRSWPVVPEGRGGRLTRFALAGRTLVWGQRDSEGSGTVAAASVDGGATQQVAAGMTALAGPAFDGTTVVWAERSAEASGSLVVGRRLRDGPAFEIASVRGTVTEVAVSGGTVAWLAGDGGADWIETTEIAP